MTDDRAEDRPGLDARMRTTLRTVALVGIALTLGALVTFGPGTALSVAVGAAIAAFNLWALARVVAGLLPATPEGARRNGAGWALVALLKMLGLVAIVWLLMRHGVVSPLPMLAGFGALPIGIAIGSAVSDRGPGTG